MTIFLKFSPHNFKPHAYKVQIINFDKTITLKISKIQEIEMYKNISERKSFKNDLPHQPLSKSFFKEATLVNNYVV